MADREHGEQEDVRHDHAARDEARREIDEPADGPGARLDADEGDPDGQPFAADETHPDDPAGRHGYGYE